MRRRRPALLPTTALLLLLAAAAAAAARAAPPVPGRSLKQQDALSNSNGCLDTIPKCEAGACATRNVMGVARWVCLRCAANYAPVVDASGQDNIVQCVCPRGTFENGTAAATCTPCPANSYCPGGDNVENPTSRGSNFSCGANLVTRTTAARSAVDCVAPAGYALTAPGSAAPCNPSEYAPQFNRLAKCLRCQSGLAEPPGSGLAAGDRASKRAVCKIPPGRYMSQGLVRICPQGFYREGWVEFSAAVGTICLPCNPGITTDGAGAGLVGSCNITLPGYGIASVLNVSGPASIPALPPTAGTGLPNATLCDLGFYSLGGYCAQCPSGTVTTAKGAKSIEECVVPPGYYLTPAGAMPPCGNGTFREGWLMYSDPRAANCTPCGDGIGSEPRDLDANPLAQNGSMVRATSASCYIEAGMGMIARGKNQFVGTDCPANTYGAAGKVYGWAAAPCKPCPRNMITDGATRVNSSDACINDDGFGYASEGASRCSPGFYSAKGSRRPCQQCPPGRTTADAPLQQRLISDCLVSPGFGVVNSTGNATDAFSPNLTGLDNTSLAGLPVLECPVGYYGAGLSVGAKCLACPAGATTQASGAVSAANCSVCMAGFGKANASDATCSLCPLGSWQPGGLTTCTRCDNATFYAAVDGATGPPWTSTTTTLFAGAWGPEACVPLQSQLSPEAGQAYFTPAPAVQALLTPSPAATLDACLAACGAAPAGCCMAQWDAAAKTCGVATLAAGSTGAPSGKQLRYKLPAPSSTGAASSLPAAGARTLASGYYAVCSIPAAAEAAWQAVGSDLTPDARAFSASGAAWAAPAGAARACASLCDNSNVCWGYVYDAAAGACLFRGGVDALASRSFFVLPGSAVLAAADWASRNSTAGGAGGNATTNGTSNSTTSGTSNSTTSGTSNSTTNGTSNTTTSGTSNSTTSTSNTTTNGTSNSTTSGTSNSTTGGTSNNTTNGTISNSPVAPFTCPAGYTVLPNNTCYACLIATVAGGGTLGPYSNPPDNITGTTAALRSPGQGVMDGKGGLLFTEVDGHRLRRIDLATNRISTIAGNASGALSGDGGPASSSQLLIPFSVTVDPVRGDAYVVDTGNHRLRVINATTGIISTYAGSSQGFAGDGATIASLKLAFPYSAAISASRMMAVADTNNGRVRLINMTSGAVSTLAGGGNLTADDVNATSARFVGLYAVAWNSRGDLAIADGNRTRVVPAGSRTIRTLAGSAVAGGYTGDGGPASAALLLNPVSLAYDAADNLYVGVSGAVRRIDAATGIITTVAGVGDATSASATAFANRFVDNIPAVTSGLINPRGVAVAPDGALYVMDNSLQRVRKVWCP